MTYLLLALIGFMAAPLPAQVKKAWVTPRTPDGHPDLQGIWTNATITTLERPAEFAGKATVSDAEARAWEKKDAEINDSDKEDSPILAKAGSAGTGFYNNLFVDRGSELARVDGVKRTSLIVDPPDGKIPVLAERARQARGARAAGTGVYDDVKLRPLAERCLVGFGSTSGPPMLPVLYNNNYQIVQTPDYVMILVEMVHDVRIVRMNGTHAPKTITPWLGDSIGHWDGDTLVVETTNFHEGNRFRGSSENLRVVERFKRVDANTILYRATIDDSATYSKPWTLEYPFVAATGPVYEYACHEGNYAITDILGGARKMEAEH
jgi:hypothetical protein